MFGVLHSDEGIQPKIQADVKENVAGGAKGFGGDNVFDIAHCCICDQVLMLCHPMTMQEVHDICTS